MEDNVVVHKFESGPPKDHSNPILFIWIDYQKICNAMFYVNKPNGFKPF